MTDRTGWDQSNYTTKVELQMTDQATRVRNALRGKFDLSRPMAYQTLTSSILASRQDHEWRYFELEGETAAKLKQFEAEKGDFDARKDALAKELGAINGYDYGSTVYFTFPSVRDGGDPPEGWSLHPETTQDEGRICSPDYKHEKFAELQAKCSAVASVKFPERRLAKWLGWDSKTLGGDKIDLFKRHAGQTVEPFEMEQVGDKTILKIRPAHFAIFGADGTGGGRNGEVLLWPEPPGCTPLAASEYYARKEKAGLLHKQPEGHLAP
ncbi:MAG: hypothetical protein Alpg2KO_26460 [Alphaproteobacteria bacterium]